MRRRLAAIAPIAVTAAALGAAPAAAAEYYVQSAGDPEPASCQAVVGASEAFRCDTLRAAVNAANGRSGADVIYLQAAGTHELAQGELTFTDDVTIHGRGPRTTAVRGSGSARVFSIAPDARVTIRRLTVMGGRAPGQEQGGNILNVGQLELFNVRVTDGRAFWGGGIANIGPGKLDVTNSLIDNNNAVGNAQLGGAGGGIVSLQGGGDVPQPATLRVVNTTVAFNRALGSGEASGTGGGIATSGSAASPAILEGVTIARNSVSGSGVGGIIVAGRGHTANIYGSIVAANTRGAGVAANCGGTLSEGDGATNLEGAGTCPFERSSQDPGVGTGLVNAGGDTDVLTIPADSLAKNIVSPCAAAIDQRAATRNPAGDGCDAGAFEQGAIAPAISSDPFPEPLDEPETPPSPQPIPVPPPTPTATPSQLPTPEVNKTVVVRKVSGRVRVRLRGTRDFVELDAVQGIPVGSTLDTRKGVVELTSVPRAGAPPETAQFYAGIFIVTQSRGITDLRLTQMMQPCSKRLGARAAAKRPKQRKLWGDGRGAFRTTGRYSAATVRGTKWLVRDSCAGTLTRVTQGTVAVRDKVRKRTVIVRAGKRYLARPKR